MTVTEKVAYLKGLAEGLGIEEDSKEGKLLKAVMDVLADLAVSVEDLEDYTAELTEQVDAIDEDLDALENDFYDDECDCCGDEDEDDFFEAECPNCKEPLVIDEDVLRAGVIECPSCHSQFAVSDECDCDDDDCDCGCGCDHDDE